MAARRLSIGATRRNARAAALSRRASWPVAALLVLAALVPLARGAAVQQHGFAFEEWVRATFFADYQPTSYTQRWDIPAAANRTHGGIPVNPKTARYGAPVDLGDALRQFDIDEPFLLIVGYWQQEGREKSFVNIVAARVEPAQWRQLWGGITRADLERLDAVIKDRSLSPFQARSAARQLKQRAPFCDAIIQVNPKIDSKVQRRLQCSLRFEDVFRHLAIDAPSAPQPNPRLWGVACPTTIASPARTRSTPAIDDAALR